jgi:tRNA A-37 threonylcarbamoyl transferase component Bud32
MATDPVLKKRIRGALLEVPGQEVVIMDDGFGPAKNRLGLHDVTCGAFKKALNSMAYKPGERYLKRLCRSGERIYRLRATGQ